VTKAPAASVASLPGELRWTLYGLVVTTPHRFVNRLVETDAPAHLWIRPVDAPPLAAGWDAVAPSYRSPAMIDERQHFLVVLVTSDATVFRFTEVVDFFVMDDGIAFQLHDPAYAHMVELHLLGFVLSYWLERAGRPALHASAVVVDGHAVAFLSNHGGGKTSLAATLVGLGYKLLSDDIVALTLTDGGPTAHPGYPQMRMWPEQARHFLGHDDLELVHPGLTKRRVPVGPDGIGTFDGTPRPLAALYLPQRRDGGEVAFETMPAGRALFELVRHTFLTGIVEGAGLATARFAALGAVAGRVPLRIVRYPNGLDLLPLVAERIADDARRIAARPEPPAAARP
jgi:hypothetical protein